MSEAPLVEVDRLRFRYPRSSSGAAAPFGLICDALRVERGERVALYGPSGCGKSTLLNLLAGALPAEGGRVLVDGVDMTRLSERERRAHRIRKMGFVFQDFPLVEHLDGLENVLLPYRLNRALDLNRDVRRRARTLLEGLGLAARAGARAAELSQGERQRVAVARALVTDPALLLADEPTAGLDAQRAESVCRMLEEATEARGMALLLVTHDQTLLGRFPRSLDVASMQSPANPE